MSTERILLEAKNVKCELTVLENAIVNAVKTGDYFNGYLTNCFSDISNHVSDNLGAPRDIFTKSIRGGLTSLVNKGVIETGEYPNGMIAFHYIADGINESEL